MTLETAVEKQRLVEEFLPAIPAHDTEFRTYLIDFTAWEVECVQARIRALEKQLELPLKYRQLEEQSHA